MTVEQIKQTRLYQVGANAGVSWDWVEHAEEHHNQRNGIQILGPKQCRPQRGCKREDLFGVPGYIRILYCPHCRVWRSSWWVIDSYDDPLIDLTTYTAVGRWPEQCAKFSTNKPEPPDPTDNQLEQREER